MQHEQVVQVGASLMLACLCLTACGAKEAADPDASQSGPVALTAGAGTGAATMDPFTVGRSTAVTTAPIKSAAATAMLPSRAPGVSSFIDCYDVVPGIPLCSGIEPLASGWIAFVAQRGPSERPELAQVRQLDGDGGWWPESDGRLDGPVWSASGDYLVWDRWIPEHPPLPRGWADGGNVVFDRSGQPIQLDEHLDLNTAPRFLSGAQTPDSAEALLMHDSTNTIAVPLTEGRPRRMPVPPSSVHETSWVLAVDGRLAALRFVPTKGQPDPPQYLVVWQHWWDGRWSNLALSGGTPFPDLRLIAWSPSGRRLLASRSGHILSNSMSWAPDLVSIDAETGVEQTLPLRWSSYGAILGARSSQGLWRPGGSEELIVTGEPRDVNPATSAGDAVSRLAWVDLSTGALRWLTNDRLRATSAAWSPDGRRIAFAAQDATRGLPEGWPMLGSQDTFEARRGMALFLLELDTGALRQLTEPGEGWDSRPEWSADGSRLLYARGFDPAEGASERAGRTQVRVLILDEGRDELILDHVGDDWAWSEVPLEPGRRKAIQADVSTIASGIGALRFLELRGAKLESGILDVEAIAEGEQLLLVLQAYVLAQRQAHRFGLGASLRQAQELLEDDIVDVDRGTHRHLLAIERYARV